jgi:hypothetical protein
LSDDTLRELETLPMERLDELSLAIFDAKSLEELGLSA